jgi:hypothetical protein
MNNPKEWYGAKTVYLVERNTVAESENLFEERIIVLQADSFDNAIAEAEDEALAYANSDSGVKYLGYVNVFKLFDNNIEHRTEVFSLMRDSSLDPEEYLDHYFNTGKERTKNSDC